MALSPIVFAAAAALAVAAFAAAWTLMPEAPRVGVLQRRLARAWEFDPSNPLAHPDEIELQRPLYDRVVQPAMNAIGGFMLRHTKQGQIDDLRMLLARAGSTQRPEAVLAKKVIGAPAGAGLGIGLVMLMNFSAPLNFGGPFLMAAVGYMLPTTGLKRKVKSRVKEIRRGLPGVLDLLTISMEAGLTFDAAMMRMTEADSGLLGREFLKVLSEIRLGKPRAEALQTMVFRNPVEELASFVRAVIQAEPLGVGIANVLRIQSEEMRRLRRQRAEQAGHRAPVLMLLPMLGCIFPCVFIMLMGPAVIEVLHSMGH